MTCFFTLKNPFVRLALAALVACAGSAQAWAADAGSCKAHIHRSAVPYVVDFDAGTAQPVDFSRDRRTPSSLDLEVAGVRRDVLKQLWVERLNEFTWKHSDVDMRGDCRRANAFGRF